MTKENEALMTKKIQSPVKDEGGLATPALEEMLTAGVHFGHQKRRWHPRIAGYLYQTGGKIHIFDLVKTRAMLDRASRALFEVAALNGPIIFVGTKRQAAEILKAQAVSCGAYFVNRRWLGGTITNFDSVRQKLNRLKKIEEGLKDGGQFSAYTKKEKLDLSRELAKLEEGVGGLKGLTGLPKALFVVDIKREATAVAEARKKKIPVVAIVDSNCSPDLVDFPIPGNDDSARSIELMLTAVSAAVKSGHQQFSKNQESTVKLVAKSEEKKSQKKMSKAVKVGKTVAKKSKARTKKSKK